MEISKELASIFLKEKTVQDVLKDIELQRENIHKKEHIFKAIAIADALENMIDSGLFEQYDIQKIKMSHYYDTSVEINTMNFYLYGQDNKGFSKYNRSGKLEDEPVEPVKKLKKVFDDFHLFHTKEISEDFREEDEKILEIKKGIGDEILNLLLSSELKSILSYSKLKNNLPDGKEDGKSINKI